MGRITVQELKLALDRKEAIAVDVRPQSSFLQGHILGAYSVPLSEIGKRHTELPRGKQVVTYCS